LAAETCSAESAIDVLVADSRDRDAFDDIVAKTGVVLDTAGPFALHGDAIVDACVRMNARYVDITGETVWVRSPMLLAALAGPPRSGCR